MDPYEGINDHEEKFREITGELGLINTRRIPFNVFDKTFLNIYFIIYYSCIYTHYILYIFCYYIVIYCPSCYIHYILSHVTDHFYYIKKLFKNNAYI